jgi:hypothetical protein
MVVPLTGPLAMLTLRPASAAAAARSWRKTPSHKAIAVAARTARVKTRTTPRRNGNRFITLTS